MNENDKTGETVKDYRDAEGVGYSIERADSDYCWVWREGNVEDYSRHTWKTIGEALRDAADDWDENGSPKPRRSAVLRGAATRAEGLSA